MAGENEREAGRGAGRAREGARRRAPGVSGGSGASGPSGASGAGSEGAAGSAGSAGDRLDAAADRTEAARRDRTRARDRARVRSAETAAAEDFDPLRIRPYVSLPDPETTAASPDPTGAALPPLRRRPLPAADADPARPYDDGSPAHDAHAPETHEGPGDHPAPARRHRSAGLLLAGAGALAAVTAATVFAVGLLSSATDGPTRDRAVPGDLASPYADPTKPAPPSAKASVSPTHSPSAPAGPTASSSRAVRSAPRPPSSPPPSTARATGSVDTRTPSSSPSSRRSPGTRLRQGDRGPQVAELQGRLAQLYLYVGERDGAYTSEVTAAVVRYQWARGLREDTPGTYGRQTRRSLEAETTEP